MQTAARVLKTSLTSDTFFCNLANAENGADIDLQTTEAGRTVFHMVLAAEVTDKRLIERMVERGALVRKEKLVLVEIFIFTAT